METADVIQILQGGGTPALLFVVYFIYKLEARLARIEKAFEMIAQKVIGTMEHSK